MWSPPCPWSRALERFVRGAVRKRCALESTACAVARPLAVLAVPGTAGPLSADRPVSGPRLVVYNTHLVDEAKLRSVFRAGQVNSAAAGALFGYLWPSQHADLLADPSPEDILWYDERDQAVLYAESVPSRVPEDAKRSELSRRLAQLSAALPLCSVAYRQL